MKRPDYSHIVIHVAQSLALALAVIFVAHLAVWVAAEGAFVMEVSGEQPENLLNAD